MSAQEEGSINFFKPVPPDSPLVAFLNANNTGHGSLISHLDRTPKRLKIIVFAIPCTFNLFLASVIFWRLTRVSTYYTFLSVLLFNELPPFSSKGGQKWYWIFIHTIADYLILKYIWPLLQEFLTDHFWLRLRWGFRDTEIVFRKPAGRERVNLVGLPPDEFNRRWMDSIIKAADGNLLTQNPGFNTRSGFWVLDYAPSHAAYAMVASGVVDLHTWELSVWLKDPESSEGWSVWELWRIQAEPPDPASFIDALRPLLLALGKPDLADKWLRIYTHPTVESPALKTHVERNDAVFELFEQEGLNYMDFLHMVLKERRRQGPTA